MALVVIGGVAAGLSAAARARRIDPRLEIVVLEKGPVISYGACGLPYLVEGRVHDARAAHRLHARVFPQGAQHRRAHRRARRRHRAPAPRGPARIRRARPLRPPGDLRPARAATPPASPAPTQPHVFTPPHPRRRRAHAPLPAREAAEDAPWSSAPATSASKPPTPCAATASASPVVRALAARPPARRPAVHRRRPQATRSSTASSSASASP